MPKLPAPILIATALLGFLLTFYPTLRSGFQRMQPDAGDVALNNYFLEHTYLWACDSSYPHSFWSPGFFTPTPKTFTYSETLIGTAPLYWLMRIAFSESVSCQLWVMLTCLLNFAAMAIVLRWFGVGSIFTAAGAYMFAFGVLRTDHLTHQQLLPQYFSPFAVWYACRFLQAPRTRDWCLLLIMAALQILASLHLGWFLGLGLIVMVGWCLILDRSTWTRLWRFWRSRPIQTMVPLLVVAGLLGLYARNFYAGTPNPRSYIEASVYAPYPDGWLVAPPDTLWEAHLTPRSVEEFPEKMLFPGFIFYATVLLAGGFALRTPARDSAWQYPSQRTLVLLLIATTLTLMVLITRFGYNLSLWYLVHSLVPGANAFRAIGRLAFVAFLFGTFGGLLGMQVRLRSRYPSPTRRTVLYVAVALGIGVEQLRLPVQSFDKEADIYGPARRLAPLIAHADAAYFVDDGTMPDYRHQITAMWAGLWARTPVMNGFSGTWPRDYPSLHDRPDAQRLAQALGPNWSGTLAVVEPGPGHRVRNYRVEHGAAHPVEVP